MKKYIEKTLIIALAIMHCTITDILGMDLRRHIFQLSDGTFQIEDEGYRWRNSFNFNINFDDGPVAIENWFFRNAGEFAPHATQSNGIHSALSTIVNDVVALPPSTFRRKYSSCSVSSSYYSCTKSK